jgi:hypothetical protein
VVEAIIVAVVEAVAEAEDSRGGRKDSLRTLSAIDVEKGDIQLGCALLHIVRVVRRHTRQTST